MMSPCLVIHPDEIAPFFSLSARIRKICIPVRSIILGKGKEEQDRSGGGGGGGR
jgi:hypothetical protein